MSSNAEHSESRTGYAEAEGGDWGGDGRPIVLKSLQKLHIILSSGGSLLRYILAPSVQDLSVTIRGTDEDALRTLKDFIQQLKYGTLKHLTIIYVIPAQGPMKYGLDPIFLDILQSRSEYPISSHEAVTTSVSFES